MISAPWWPETPPSIGPLPSPPAAPPQAWTPIVGPWGWILLGKYIPNKESKEIIGFTEVIFYWMTDSGIDNSIDDAGNSGLDLDKFDTTTRSDSAWIRIYNSSGSEKIVRGAAIRGSPVVRLSGENGYIHDDFIDYEDIYKNGENKFELGNNYIVTKDQVEQLADWHWKNFRAKRHVYVVSMIGARYWFSPGEFYTIQIGSVGQREYIDSVVECYMVQTERGVGDIGHTIIAFREIYQNFVHDSNAIARFIASGDPKGIYNFGRVVVAARDYLGAADYYCDGTSDEDEINAAINEIAGLAGGVIELTEGTYYIDGSIDPTSNIVLMGKGAKTVIEKNCNDHGIDCTGSEGNEIVNVMLKDFAIQKNSADTNANKYLINWAYVNDSFIYNIKSIGQYSTQGTLPANAANVVGVGDYNKIINCTFMNGYQYALYWGGENNIIQSNHFKDNYIDYNINGDRNLINANSAINGDYRSADIAGIENLISNNQSINCTRLAPSLALGIPDAVFRIEGIKNKVISNIARDNSNLLVDGDCESTSPAYIYNDGSSINNLTVARSTEQQYQQSYSHLVTKTSAATGEYRFCDNIDKDDLHTLIPGYAYNLSAQLYRLATGSPSTAEISLIIGYTTSTVAAWTEQSGNPSTSPDDWSLIETECTISANAVSAKALLRINSGATTGEYIYLDRIRLQPKGVHNEYKHNFADADTGETEIGQNSWQSIII